MPRQCRRPLPNQAQQGRDLRLDTETLRSRPSSRANTTRPRPASQSNGSTKDMRTLTEDEAQEVFDFADLETDGLTTHQGRIRPARECAYMNKTSEGYYPSQNTAFVFSSSSTFDDWRSTYLLFLVPSFLPLQLSFFLLFHQFSSS